MTIQQQAHDLIDHLPEDSVHIIVALMNRMSNVPDRGISQRRAVASAASDAKTNKMRAFERMQELRKECLKYELQDFDLEREAAMKEKYGEFMG